SRFRPGPAKHASCHIGRSDNAVGPEILRKMAMREPGTLARMAYATLPKDILVSVEQRIPGGLAPEDWALLTQVLDLIRSAIPPDSNAPPAEVFGVIETALRAHFARAIEALTEE